MAGQTIAVSVLADTAPFAKAMKGVGIGVAAGLATAAVGLGALMATSIKAAAESEKVVAQTNAVLASTGGAAGRTADQIGDLATGLSRLSGVDDEVIQSGSNILATFTQIKGVNFDAATSSALNMSVALGKDMASSATLVGKALNDPVKGIGALSKVGVQLTAEQKALVEQMSAVGDVAGAQSVILGVLEQQFGGSAEAAGGTFLGALGKVQTEFGNLQETLGAAFLPALTAVMQKVADVLALVGDSAAFSAIVTRIGEIVTALFSADSAMGGLSFDGILTAIIGAVTGAAAWLAGGGLESIFAAITDARGGMLDAAMEAFPGILDALIVIAPQVVAGLAAMVTQLVGFLTANAPALLAGAVSLLSGLIGAAAQIVPPLITSLLAILPALVGSLLSMLPTILAAAIELLGAIVAAVPVILPPLITAIVAMLPMLVTSILEMIPAILDGAISLFTSLVEAIPVILPLLIVAIIELLPKLITTIVGMLPKILDAAIKLFTGLVTAIPKILPALIPAILRLLPEMVGALIGMVPQLLKAGVDLIGGLVRGLWQAAGSVGKALLDIIGGAVDGFLSFLGIHSPSRLFRGYGANVVEGLARGLADTSSVERAMSALSAVVDDGYTPLGALDAPRVTSTARGAVAAASGTPGTAADPGIVELGPATIHALVQAMRESGDVFLDGRALAQSAGAHFAESARLGGN